MRRRLLVVVKAMLQEQGVEVGAQDQVDRHRRLIQGCLALEVSGLPTFLQDLPKQLLDAFFVGKHCLPALGSGGCGNLVKLAVLKKQAKARLGQGFEHPSQFLWGPIAPRNGCGDLGFDLAQAVCADHLANGLLGLKELVDVSLGETYGLGEIGDGRLFVPVAAEMLRGCGDDLISHLVLNRASGRNGIGTCLIHRGRAYANSTIWIISDYLVL